MLVADLHIHSRFSRATSRDLDAQRLFLAARQKGIDLLGSGDFTHPEWVAELKQMLEPTGDGAFRLKSELAAPLAQYLPPACAGEVRFLLSGEISSIYKRHGKTRKVHSLVLMPDFESVDRLNATLGRLGNIKSDGRPILGLDARDLLEICLAASPEVLYIPAHIWTPWFSLFGSKSGFDSIEECYDDLTGHIHALETGLSSDPPMNWRLSALDRFRLVSNSDAHSAAKLAREATLFDCPPTYQDLAAALKPGGPGYLGTLEFFPDEGKYHLDGHRKCGVRLTPAQTREAGGRCPVCGGPITVGVLNRVEELADRPEGIKPPNAGDFESIVPLDEVIAEALGRGPATKGVRAVLEGLLVRLGPELFILRQCPLEDVRAAGGPVLAEAVDRIRRGKVIAEGGYDGEFGVIKVFEPQERRELQGQARLWAAQAPAAPAAPKPNPAKDEKKSFSPRFELTSPAPDGDTLNPEQLEAAQYGGGPLLVRAGPGSGKTRMLTHRAARLLETGEDPAGLVLVTFTRKAAAELAQRLALLSGRAALVQTTTFHGLGWQILAQARGSDPRVLSEEERLDLIRPLAKGAGEKPARLAESLSLCKQSIEPPEDPIAASLLQAYQAMLAQFDAFDLDDLVREAALALQANPALAGQWQGRLRHILVDEYQDVNPAQVELLRLLAAGEAVVSAIGDPDQAIYGFRGADKSYFNRFADDFPGAKVGTLSRNYRNSGRIVAASQALLAGDPDPARPAARAMGGEGARITLCDLANPAAEAAWVARKVAELLGGLDSRQVEAGWDGGGDLGARDIAILYRLHALAKPLTEALGELGVPYQAAAEEPMAETEPLDFSAQRVSLLSLHAAKGLEFKAVFIVGLEEGLLPYQPPGKPPADRDEERRLLYVGLTRAERLLFLSRSRRRTLFGETSEPGPSPFLAALPAEHLQKDQPPKRKPKQLGLFS